MPSLLTLLAWLCTAAGVGVAVCSLLLAWRGGQRPLLRFGPLATVGAYLACGAIHFLVEGVGSVLLLPDGLFGLYLAARLLACRSALAYTLVGCSFVFWPPALFIFGRYVFLRFLHAAP